MHEGLKAVSDPSSFSSFFPPFRGGERGLGLGGLFCGADDVAAYVMWGRAGGKMCTDESSYMYIP